MNTKNQSSPSPASRSTTTGNLDAFTLIELALVIAIIGLLAVMVLPALAGTKGRACAANDISNFKQTMIGMTMYCSDNNDYMPAPGWSLSSDCWITAANPPAMSRPHSSTAFQQDYDWQVSWFTGSKAPESGSPTPPRHGLLYPYLINPKLFLCPQDVVNANYLKRSELISSYVWNGAVVGYHNNVAAYKITKFKPTNILQWENDETLNPSGGNWGDFANTPVEAISTYSFVPDFSQRHGNVAPVGRIDGSAGRVLYADMVRWAYDTSKPNDLWYSPVSANGH